MRCPKCKATLIYAGKREYETLVDHVSNPNREKFPLRSTYICPNVCFGKSQFFGFGAASYAYANWNEEKYWSALNSIDRKSNIQTHLDMPYRKRYRNYVIALRNLIIEGERDIPPRWTWGFYWLKGRLMRIYYRYLY